jgi:periplasmic protein TonB
MAEYEAIEIEGLAGPDSGREVERDSAHPSVFAISLDPGVHSSRRALEWTVFAASLAVHIVIFLRVHNDVTPQVTRFVASQVEVELTPPPPVEEPKIKEPEPPPDPPPQAEKPVPHVQTQAPVAQAPVNLPDNSNLPSSDEGLLPPTPAGTGTPGPAPVLAPPPPPPPPPPPAAIIPIKVPPNFGATLKPVYPRRAIDEEWEGTVVLRVEVLPSGHTGNIIVVKSSGHSALDESAVASARPHVFAPATQGGVPVATSVSFPVTFKLQ